PFNNRLILALFHYFRDVQGNVMRYRVALIVTAILLTTPLSAHPPDEIRAQRATVVAWAEALASRNADAAAEFALSVQIPRFFIDDVTQVVTRYATYHPTDDGVVASPILVYVDGGSFRIRSDLHLVEVEGVWKVSAITPSDRPMPEALVNRNLPEHVALEAAQFKLVDADTGQPVFARVRIVDNDGGYWPPDGHQKNIRTGWREDVGGDVLIDGKTWAYVEPEFTVRVPAGEYTIEVAKGTEYLPTSATVRVAGGGQAPHLIEINRWSDLNSEGWYAGDTHTHFLGEQSGLIELRGEGLSVIYILATKWGELITDVERFSGQPSIYSTDREIVVYNEETRHGWLGHTILHGISKLVYPLTWGGPSEGVIGGFDYPPMAHQADAAHALGGLVTWAHFPFPGGELAVDIALDKIDTIDIFTWGDPFSPGGLLPGGTPAPSALDDWYRFLNTNARLPATAGTDKMVNVQVSGSVRTWAYIGEEFSYRGWLDALEAGRTFVSTGPIVRLTANGSPVGSDLQLSAGTTVVLEASMQAPFDIYPVERLEIIAGGKVIASVANGSNASELNLSVEITPEMSTWVAARANGSKLLPYQAWPLLGSFGIPPMAHTSPIYLTVDGRPIWSPEDAAILAGYVQNTVDWATDTGNYLNDAQRKEVIDLYKRALEFYQR
ncbi:MAG: CehA/McbA family metallohydrolase, partial [Gammaproteobacteria bacterium]|nr:CehA/McbA family metallohydrolase [Gammaproteobacteria bacterium]